MTTKTKLGDNLTFSNSTLRKINLLTDEDTFDISQADSSSRFY